MAFMTLRDFVRLSEPAKEEVIWVKGNLVTEEVIHGYKVAVYKVNNFFVEAYYDLKNDALIRLKGCVRSDLLPSLYAS
jgi:hypothetical protein